MTRRGSPEGYQERRYRRLVSDAGFVSFEVAVKETDLYIKAVQDLSAEAREAVLRHRRLLEDYIRRHPGFLESLVPVEEDPFAPPIVREMIGAARNAGVGPMAAVAGAMAEAVGRDLLPKSPEVVVENGGDIFLCSERELRVAIYAGDSPLSYRLALQVSGAAQGKGICTSSGTVGPSLSFGRADVVCILSPSAALADAAATAVGNLVQTAADVNRSLEAAQAIPGVGGALIIIGAKLGAWGEVQLTPI